jgi:hypothetical protein
MSPPLERLLTPEQNELRRLARIAVTNAFKAGALVRQACEVCGTWPGQAHHEDYAKPLDVTWLCQAHHTARHQERAAS